MSLQWIATQIQAMKVETPNLVRFNPRPPGVIREGSATEEVFRLLRANPGRYFSYAEIRSRCTHRSHAALSWGLIYLKRMGMVQVVGDDARNPQYLRYRIAKES